ncbi:MAG TPA: toll/interleukin-1 receptor domain-containing protein [Ktedonobacterales bacterium]|jgi:tetratricopeptide (TPR) repeat protein
MAEATQQLRVFVSHSHEDDAFCRAIVTALRDAGADVWYDEHNMGSGLLMSVIQSELGTRPVFVVILSKAAFASEWVKREATWAYQMAEFDPTRTILPVTATPIAREDFTPASGWFFLYGYKRIEAPGYQAYAAHEAAGSVLRALSLTPVGEAPAPVAPQPTESVNDLLPRGRALLAQKKYLEALPHFELATQIFPSSFEAWANLGQTFFLLGSYEGALAPYDHALALDDKQAWVWINKGTALGGLLRHEEELAAYDRALALDPNAASTWRGKGIVLNDLKRYDEALVAYEQALALDPTDWWAWQGKAQVLIALGRVAEAEAAERRAGELGYKG